MATVVGIVCLICVGIWVLCVLRTIGEVWSRKEWQEEPSELEVGRDCVVGSVEGVRFGDARLLRYPPGTLKT